MGIEYKAVAVSGVRQIKDEGKGIVTAFVSVTGLKDNVNDIIEPGAYTDTLTIRTPKGAWSHKWDKPTSKTLEVKELLPGSKDLPKTLANGQPWPKEAGALKLKMQFNLGTQRGRDAYSDVTFFGDQQEWSIGYKVPEGGATIDKKSGVRRIHKLNLYEYSPVLFGAMPEARTSMGVKGAQMAFKSLMGEDDEDWTRKLAEYKALAESGDDYDADLFDGDDYKSSYEEEDEEKGGMGEYCPPGSKRSKKKKKMVYKRADDEYDDEEDDEYSEDDEAEMDSYDEDDAAEEDDIEEDEDDGEDDGEKVSPARARQAINALEGLLAKENHALGADKFDSEFLSPGEIAYVEAKALLYDTVAAAVEDIDIPLDDEQADSLAELAEEIDAIFDAEEDPDEEGKSDEFFDIIEDLMSDAEGKDIESLRVVARVYTDRSDSWLGEDSSKDNEDDAGFTYKDDNGNEYKNQPTETRNYGSPADGDGYVDIDGEEKSRAYIVGLPTVPLVALDDYLTASGVDSDMLSTVKSEIDARLLSGQITFTEFKAAQRHVRDAAFWGMPVGTPIKPGMKPVGRGGGMKKPAKPAAPKATAKKAKAAKPSAAQKPSAKKPAGPASVKKPNPKAASTFNPKKLAASVDAAKSREEAHALLAPLKAQELRDVAAVLKHPAAGRTKPEMRQNIVEFTVGNRLDSEAIRRSVSESGKERRAAEKAKQTGGNSGSTDKPKPSAGIDATSRALFGDEPLRGSHEYNRREKEKAKRAAEEVAIPAREPDPSSYGREIEGPTTFVNFGPTDYYELDKHGRRVEYEPLGDSIYSSLQNFGDPNTVKRPTFQEREYRRMLGDKTTFGGITRTDFIDAYGRLFPDNPEEQAFGGLEERLLDEVDKLDDSQAFTYWRLRGSGETHDVAMRRASMRRMKDDHAYTEFKRVFAAKRREAMAKTGAAMEDGSYPIETVGDLENAIQACGRAKDPDKAKAHIKKRAKALGREDLIPDEWKAGYEEIDLKALAEFKSLLEDTDD